MTSLTTNSGTRTRTACPTYVTRSYQIQQPVDGVEQSINTTQGDHTNVSEKSEFSSDGPFKFKYYQPRTADWSYFQDDLHRQRRVREETCAASTDGSHFTITNPPGKIITTKIIPGDLFEISGKPGTWEFVGVSQATPEKLVFKPHDRRAEQNRKGMPSKYITKYKNDFSHRFAPFESTGSTAEGHLRVGTKHNVSTLPLNRPEQDLRENKNIAASPEPPDPKRGPMYPTGVMLKTYDRVPQSLRQPRNS